VLPEPQNVGSSSLCAVPCSEVGIGVWIQKGDIWVPNVSQFQYID
jgi:hypothetical protein